MITTDKRKHHSFFKFKGLKYFSYFAVGSFVFLYIFMGTQDLDVDAVQAYSSTGRRITAANISNAVDVVTEDVSADEQAAANGNSVASGAFQTLPIIEYTQYEGPWASEQYGTGGTFRGTACGITSLATVMSTITQTQITPQDVEDECPPSVYNYGYSDRQCLVKTFNHFADIKGFKDTWEITLYEGTFQATQAKAVIDRGGACIVDGHAVYTSGGHYIVLAGWDEAANKFKVSDPGGTTWQARGLTAAEANASDIWYWYGIEPKQGGN